MCIRGVLDSADGVEWLLDPVLPGGGGFWAFQPLWTGGLIGSFDAGISSDWSDPGVSWTGDVRFFGGGFGNHVSSAEGKRYHKE